MAAQNRPGPWQGRGLSAVEDVQGPVRDGVRLWTLWRRSPIHRRAFAIHRIPVDVSLERLLETAEDAGETPLSRSRIASILRTA